MANILLTWVPVAGTNSSSQDVQYKLRTSSTYITHSSVSSTTNTASINGLADNYIYDFRIVNNCPYGGPTPSNVRSDINILCPSLTLSPTYDTVTFGFSHPASSITSYVVDLLNSSNAVLASQTITTLTPSITGSFNGLTANTLYRVRVTVNAETFNKVCTAQDVTTSAPPTCDAPTNVNAVFS